MAAAAASTTPLLEVQGLNVAFNTERGEIRPVRDVSFAIHPGQTLAVVGESGSGKSVSALSILRLIPEPPGKILAGSIRFEGRDLLGLSEREMRAVRGKDIAMIFQEPMTSLNPVYTIGDQIAEAVVLHQRVSMSQAYNIAEQALRDVGIADPRRRLFEYPHQMSGGMRQRVMIAMALSCKPKLLIADEPTTALDVTIQAQILELLRKLQREQGMAILLITHDLGVVAENADVVVVMYASRVVEVATVEELFDRPQHPYTEALFRSIPSLTDRRTRLDTIPGTVPNPAKFPAGCKFHPRCHRTRELATGAAEGETVSITSAGETFRVMKRCVVETQPAAGTTLDYAGNAARSVADDIRQTSGEPALREVRPGHWARCHYAENFDAAPVTTPRLAHRREVTAETVEGDRLPPDVLPLTTAGEVAR
jgi:peptide/nickel transport system ATP-binding protein